MALIGTFRGGHGVDDAAAGIMFCGGVLCIILCKFCGDLLFPVIFLIQGRCHVCRKAADKADAKTADKAAKKDRDGTEAGVLAAVLLLFRALSFLPLGKASF